MSPGHCCLLKKKLNVDVKKLKEYLTDMKENITNEQTMIWRDTLVSCLPNAKRSVYNVKVQIL